MLTKITGAIVCITSILFDFTFIMPVRYAILVLLSLFKLLTMIEVMCGPMVNPNIGNKLSDKLKEAHNEYYDWFGRIFKFKINTSDKVT